MLQQAFLLIMFYFEVLNKAFFNHAIGFSSLNKSKYCKSTWTNANIAPSRWKLYLAHNINTLFPWCYLDFHVFFTKCWVFTLFEEQFGKWSLWSLQQAFNLFKVNWAALKMWFIFKPTWQELKTASGSIITLHNC